MNVRKEFDYTPQIDITAAQIGISKWNWAFTDSEELEDALRIMVGNNFDVLPIKNRDGRFDRYFSTIVPNDYSSIVVRNIEDSVTIYYRLSFKDLIHKFKQDKSRYFFVRDSDGILGLVTVADLNSILAYYYLFSVVAEIEIGISELFERYVDQDEVIKYFSESKDKFFRKVANDFQLARNNNSESNIFQTLYLIHLAPLLKHFSNQFPAKYSKLSDFYLKLSPDGIFSIIRNKVMHPVRPIISDLDSICQIDELLHDYAVINNILNSNLEE